MKPQLIIQANALNFDYVVEFQRALIVEEGRQVSHTLVDGVGKSVDYGHYSLMCEAEEDCRLAPVACIRCVPVWSDWHNGNWGMVDSLYVLPSHRGQGIATKLIQYLRDSGNFSCGLFLYVRPGNTPAQNCYRKFGFTESDYITMELRCAP